MYILIYQNSKACCTVGLWTVFFQWFNTSKYRHACANRGLGCSRQRIMNAGELSRNERLLYKRITIIYKHVVLRPNELMKSDFLWSCVLWSDFPVCCNEDTAGEAFQTSFFIRTLNAEWRWSYLKNLHFLRQKKYRVRARLTPQHCW